MNWLPMSKRPLTFQQAVRIRDLMNVFGFPIRVWITPVTEEYRTRRSPGGHATLLAGRISSSGVGSDRSCLPVQEFSSYAGRCLTKVFGLGYPELGLASLSSNLSGCDS